VNQRAPLAGRLAGFGTTIFAEMSALANRTGAVNLGQGFPDTDGPAEVLEAAVAALRAGHNQYPPGPGIAALREAIAASTGSSSTPRARCWSRPGRPRGSPR
jgi:N-succinyldiaminopimelate aminotransferase